ncbi:MAG: hypothetical protein ACREA2_19745 [Blastocatellia bacterium]
MRRSPIYFIIGLLTLIIGVGATTGCIIYGPTDEAMKQPPCDPTSRSQNNPDTCSRLSSQAIPIVPFCTLVSDPERYIHKVVRTQAKLYSDSGDHAMSDPVCSGEGKSAFVDFDSSYGITSEAQKAFDVLLCNRRRYHANKEADVVVVGRFADLDGKPGNRYRRIQFVIMCIEQAKNQRLTYGDR